MLELLIVVAFEIAPFVNATGPSLWVSALVVNTTPLLSVTPPIELVVPGAVISLANSVTPPIELFPALVVMTPSALFPLTFSVVPFHVSPEFALIVPGFDVVVIR